MSRQLSMPLCPQFTRCPPVSPNPVSPNPISPNLISQNPVSPNSVTPNPVLQNPISQNPVSPNPVSQNPVSLNPVSQKPVSPTSGSCYCSNFAESRCQHSYNILRIVIMNAQSASLRSLLAAESTVAETNAASSFERSPAMNQIYKILTYFFEILFKFCPTLLLPPPPLHLPRAQLC